MEHPAVSRFREYLRINTTSVANLDLSSQQPDYDGAVKFLQRMAEELDLPFECIEVVPRRPVVVITWTGSQPDLPSIMLNSHMDVVPVFPEHWVCDPFEAYKKENGDVVARGTQDMKCCGMWYLEAVRRLKVAKKSLLRTVHVVFVPDEEIGGMTGMGAFVKTDFFKKLNIGFCLDEGLANPTNAFTVFYGERSAWWFTITCPGNPGHGSRFIENTAVEKVHKIMNCLLEYRKNQQKMLENNPSLSLGDVTSVNVNVLEGGVQFNVVPSEMCIKVDIRVTPTESHEELEAKLHKWVRSAGDDCTIAFSQKGLPFPITDTDSPWWKAFSTACNKHEISLQREIFAAGSDCRFLRMLNIPALGFSAINNTPILLHDHNEFLNEDTFLRGIGIYEDIIVELASLVEN